MQYSGDDHAIARRSRHFANSRNFGKAFARIRKVPAGQRLGGRSCMFREIGAIFAESRPAEADGAVSFFFRLFNAVSDVRG
jgi:hypothetical protein